ncbi:hypothetical protein HID58_076612 [Brassica napus]|uniref:Uncharacterized protein n=1 Tax=Brassica napus TaxID=3708 RepID=A0ABQ7YMZ7_BRANA|nr:hypothetical protein HID58_076612 [Brassica napus]
MRPFLRKKIVPWIYHYKFYCFVDQYNKTVDPGPVPNVLRIKPSPFTAPDSDAGQKPVIKGVIGMQIGEVARLRNP